MTTAGPQQRLQCVPVDGSKHYFSAPLPAEVPATLPPRTGCPTPEHADARVQARGTRVSGAGTWTRYSCHRPDGATHSFSVLSAPEDGGKPLLSLERPPACPDHSRSNVTRHGSFGKGDRKRQRYLCVSADGTRHSFTPPLTRKTVEVGVESCATCQELLSPHRGAQTGARHTPWGLRLIVQALNDLSQGGSYASISLAMRAHRDRAAKHLHGAHGIDLGLDLPPDVDLDTGVQRTGEPVSFVAAEGKKAWHLAADLVEQYSPLLWVPVRDELRAQEVRQRELNDAALARRPGGPLDAPLTYIVDEQPVVLRRPRKGSRRLQQLTWTVLVVVEVAWEPPPDPSTWPRRHYRLRLMRAYPRMNVQAWRLVFDELGARPDFVVADSGTAIGKALTAHYGDGAVGFIPSLFHLHRNLREGLRKLKGTTVTVEGRSVLRPELLKHLDLLTREDLLNSSPKQWAAWWDVLITDVERMGVPTVTLASQRQLYEPSVNQAMPLLATHPYLPASNAAVENRIRHVLAPFLDNRKHLYRNLARTNFLFDLAVCRAHGVFTDLDEVADLIRRDNEQASGWAPAPRTLGDAQPPPRADGVPRLYSSLLNPLLVSALAETRLGSTP